MISAVDHLVPCGEMGPAPRFGARKAGDGVDLRVGRRAEERTCR